MVKDFYPTQEEYEELEDMTMAFDCKDKEIKYLKNEIKINLFCGILLGIALGAFLFALLVTFFN